MECNRHQLQGEIGKGRDFWPAVQLVRATAAADWRWRWRCCLLQLAVVHSRFTFMLSTKK
jgi:hypothetical protein